MLAFFQLWLLFAFSANFAVQDFDLNRCAFPNKTARSNDYAMFDHLRRGRTHAAI
jgi:hypothetical protein